MTTTAAQQWVAELYDAYVTATFDLDYLVDAATVAGGPVLELLAGTGRVSLPLARAGANLTCVELSAPMLDQLRRKLKIEGLKATLIEADVARMSLPRDNYALAMLPFNALGELLDEADRRATFDIVRRHLRPGGRFICTLHNPVGRSANIDGQLRLLGSFKVRRQQRTLLLWSVQLPSPEPGLVQSKQIYELYDDDGVLQEKYLLDVRFRLIGQDEAEAMAAAAGFEIDAFYGNYDRASFDPDRSPYMIWEFVARGTPRQS